MFLLTLIPYGSLILGMASEFITEGFVIPVKSRDF